MWAQIPHPHPHTHTHSLVLLYPVVVEVQPELVPHCQPSCLWLEGFLGGYWQPEVKNAIRVDSWIGQINRSKQMSDLCQASP